MKQLPLRSLDMGTGAAWPAEVPELRTVRASRLWVPLLPRPLEGRSVRADLAGEVVAGTLLSDKSIRNAAAVHAPMDGRIVGAGEVLLSGGARVEAVEMAVHAPVRAPEPIGTAPPLPDAVPADLGPWLDRLIDCGVNAHRLACPDLLGQLTAALRRPVDTVICSLLPTDEHLRLGAVLAATFPRELSAGVALLGRLTGATNRWIVGEAGTPARWGRSLREAAGGMGLRVLWMRHDYPQDDPVLLLYALLDRRLRPGRLPTDQGTIVLDAAAAIAIGRCALLGEPTLAVPLAIRDQGRRENYHLWAAPGTALGDVLATVGIAPAAVELRVGHILRDRITSPSAVVGGSELVFHAVAPQTPVIPEACIRCGWCIDGCPVRIHPAMLLEASQRRNLGMGERFGMHACIECGICTYVCPSQLPLMASIRRLRAQHG